MNKQLLLLEMAEALAKPLGIETTAIAATLERQGVEPTAHNIYLVAYRLMEQAQGYAQSLLPSQDWDEWLES